MPDNDAQGAPEWHDLGPVEELKRSALREVRIGRTRIALTCKDGEFGAVSVVSGHIRGKTNTMPLHVEILYNEYNFVAAFGVASLLALLALVTLAAKALIEGKTRSEAKARSEEKSVALDGKVQS